LFAVGCAWASCGATCSLASCGVVFSSDIADEYLYSAVL
jgi:hypothetical protein